MATRSGFVILSAVVAAVLALPGGLRAVPQSNSAQTTPAQQRVFRAGVDIVTVDAYPRRNGRLVEGLTADDFELLEDGKPQRIEQFDFVRIEPSPDDQREDPSSAALGLGQVGDPYRRVFVVYLDIFHIVVLGSQTVRSPVVTLIDNTIGANDLVGFLTPRLSPATIRFTRKRQTVEEEFLKYWHYADSDRMELKDRDPEEKQLELCYGSNISQALIARRRMALSMDGLSDLVDFMSQLRAARTYVLVVADNWDLPRQDPALQLEIERGESMIEPRTGRGSANTLDRFRPIGGSCKEQARQWFALDLMGQWMSLIEYAQKRNVVFYTISPRAVSTFTGANDPLISLAHSTDGESIMSPKEFGQQVDRMGPDTSAYYLLGYRAAPEPANGRPRQIKVRVKQQGVSVTARRAYAPLTPKEIAISAAINRADAEGPVEIRTALGKIAEADLPQPLSIYGVEWQPGEQLAVIAELSEPESSQPRWAKGGVMEVDVTGSGGEALGSGSTPLEAGARGAIVRVPVTVSLRAWRISVRLRSGADVVATRGVVLEAGGGLLADPMFYRGASSGQALMRPAATPTFRRTERVRIEVGVRSPLDRRSARLLDRLGQPLPMPITLTERVVEGVSVLDADLPLSPLAPGDYIVHISAGAGTANDDRYVAIRVK